LQFVQEIRDVLRADLPIAGLGARIAKLAAKDEGTGLFGDLG
jgi:hypothetical protein